MSAAATAGVVAPRWRRANDPDGRVVMHGLDWWKYEAMLAIRGDAAGARLSYLEGDLEIMTPSRTHESIKKTLARLLEAYAEERGIFFNGYGALTMKNPAAERGAEPDECYCVGSDKERPDLAIEVIWTSGGLDKRRLYLGLGVRELWEWRDGRIDVFVLAGAAYAAASKSSVLPDLDLALITRLLDRDDQTEAVRELRRALRETVSLSPPPAPPARTGPG
jgi:Uma2 family endonuclease